MDKVFAVPAELDFVGTTTIEAYTVMHDADGPTHGIMALRTGADHRTWGRVEASESIDELLASEAIGKSALVDDQGLARLVDGQRRHTKTYTPSRTVRVPSCRVQTNGALAK